MTVPHLMNCPHSDEGWCLDCVVALGNENWRLRDALRIVREYPDFDAGGALPEMLDQVLRGEPAPMLDALDRLALGPNVPHQRAP